MDAPNLNQLWADLIIETLTRNGIHHVVVAPGSRSAPLAVAAARNKRVNTLVHFDERGAAFAALGSGKMGHPAAVITTSGTALANCFPAVAEARMSATPLIILSADRPPELQGCGANQTMDQQGIFGGYVLADATIPCPDVSVPLAAMLAEVNAVITASGTPGQGGPVHLNCRYREPLAPDTVRAPWPDSYTEELHGWMNNEVTDTQTATPVLALSDAQLRQVTTTLSAAKNGLLLIGQLATPEDRNAALAVAAGLQWPVFADITSGCRCAAAGGNFINAYDFLLRSERFRARCIPDVILHIGDVFVSKRLQEHLATIRPEYIHLSCRNEKRDPIHRVTQQFHVNLPTACGQIASVVPNITSTSGLLELCRDMNQVVRALVSQGIETDDAFTELSIASEVNAACANDTALYIGNSMPIRDLDMTTEDCAAVALCANRGVSGIDGNIATAAGMAWSSGMPTLAVIGDVAALHDVNSLALLTKIKAAVVLVVINNGGGGIFSFLPIARHEDLLDPYFTNSHDWRFDRAAAMFGLPYRSASNREQLRKALEETVRGGASAVIEAHVLRDENVRAHHSLAHAVTDMVDNRLGKP